MAVKELELDPIEAPASVVATLRQLILGGHFPPGTRLAEIPVAQTLGVSRTPVRLAFRTLNQEGLLQRVGKRGLEVRAFTEADVLCAVEVRGVLEGLAARRLAEAGVAPAQLEQCLAEGEQVLAGGRLTARDVDRWSALNQRFGNSRCGRQPRDRRRDRAQQPPAVRRRRFDRHRQTGGKGVQSGAQARERLRSPESMWLHSGRGESPHRR